MVVSFRILERVPDVRAVLPQQYSGSKVPWERECGVVNGERSTCACWSLAHSPLPSSPHRDLTTPLSP